MKRSILLSLFVFVGMFLSSCNETSDNNVDSPLEVLKNSDFSEVSYFYIGFNDAGETIALGELQFAMAVDTSLSGTWEFTPWVTPDIAGPQDGQGAFSGEFTHSVALLRLPPNANGHTLSLAAFGFADGKLNGSWLWKDADDNVKGKGAFEAAKIEDVE